MNRYRPSDDREARCVGHACYHVCTRFQVNDVVLSIDIRLIDGGNETTGVSRIALKRARMHPDWKRQNQTDDSGCKSIVLQLRHVYLSFLLQSSYICSVYRLMFSFGLVGTILGLIRCGQIWKVEDRSVEAFQAKNSLSLSPS